MDLALHRLLVLFDILPQPLRGLHRTPPFDVVHVAGTNGKGSVSSLIAQCVLYLARETTFPVCTAKLIERDSIHAHVGAFVSPHLVTPDDSVIVDGIRIVEYYPEIWKQAHEIVETARNTSNGDAHTTPFETLFCKALVAFALLNVDVAIIEVGLGGRLDATNVIFCDGVPHFKDPKSSSLTCVFCEIALDHQGILGNTVQQIAIEKAGIIKPGCRIVIAPSMDKVPFDTIIERKGSSLVYHSNSGSITTNQQTSEHLLLGPSYNMQLKINSQNCNVSGTMALPGDHQLDNLNTAINALQSLIDIWEARYPEHTFNSSLICSLVSDAIATTVIKGRLEYLISPLDTKETMHFSSPYRNQNNATLFGSKNMIVLLDGAHNEHASKGLHSYIASRILPALTKANVPRLYMIIAISQGKEAISLLQDFLLLPKSPITIIPVFAEFPAPSGMPWVASYSMKELSEMSPKINSNENSSVDFQCFNSGGESRINKLLEVIRKKEDDIESNCAMVAIIGSLYLISDFYTLCKVN